MNGRRVILLLGAHGQLGRELCPLLGRLGELVCAVREPRAAGELPVDLADAATLSDLLAAVRPAVVVNAAAYTAVERAEREPENARLVNEVAPGILARGAAAGGATLIHYSTDYVFDGTATRPYREDDPPSPLGVYARTKLAGEQAVAASGAAHFVLRTGWLYSGHGRNFVTAILGRWREGLPLRVVDDQTGAPTWAGGVARVSAEIVSRALAADPDWARREGGIYHLAAAGETTWLGFARAVLAGHGEPDPIRRVQPVSTAEYGAAAPRPAYSVLDCSRLARRHGLSLGHWQRELEAMLRSKPEVV